MRITQIIKIFFLFVIQNPFLILNTNIEINHKDNNID